jgi:3-oxoacyl-[acyl-carrier protein] reductase
VAGAIAPESLTSAVVASGPSVALTGRGKQLERHQERVEHVGSTGEHGERMEKLTDKVAIVTGASKGIRTGIATAMAAAGARVAVNYAGDKKGAERVARTIVDRDGQAIAVGADVSKAADVARMFKEVDDAFGRLDILVNNAGIFRFGAFTDITEEAFHVHYNINVLGTILLIQQAIKRFGPEGGSVINLSSIVGSFPVPGALLYASTKAAIENLTRGLAVELAPRKIRVNAISPGHTETEGNVTAGTFADGAGEVLARKTPLGRLGRVTDIAPLAVFLASDESAWITGEIIRAAGGLVVAN